MIQNKVRNKRAGTSWVIPTPQLLLAEEGELPFLGGVGGHEISLIIKDAEVPEWSVCEFTQALNKKAGKEVDVRRDEESFSSIRFETVSDEELASQFANWGVTRKETDIEWEQAYGLENEETSGGVQVVCQATSPVGHHYGFLTLAQLLRRQDGEIVVPIFRVADWPSIPLRLGKTSASTEDLPTLKEFYRWLALGKMNLIGLQYHGNCSRNRESEYQKRMEIMGEQIQQDGIMRLVAYCCPFRGDEKKQCPLHLENEGDLEHYIMWLTAMLEAGASGVEIDYNDWAETYGPNPPKVGSIFNKIFWAIREKKSDALVLHCPPHQYYRGSVKPDLAAISEMVPPDLHFLWTGPQTLIPEHPIPTQEFEEWEEKMRRKPFLWVNRVSADGKRPLSAPLEGRPDALVIRTDAFPRGLPDLVTGIHLNLGKILSKQGLTYFATACDYFWNPDGFNPERSWHAARAFNETFT